MTADQRPMTNDHSGVNALASIRRFARRPIARERCELCDAELAADHAHLVEVGSRRMACACDACALLFEGQGGARFRRVPRRVQFLPEFHFSDAAWEGLNLPINLAFLLHSTPAGSVIALYPSPAGITEAMVSEEAWKELAEDNPVVRRLAPDVEGLLFHRVGAARECYRVGIDECFKLAGLLRIHWRGLSGGPVVWDEIGRFFAGMKERSTHA